MSGGNKCDGCVHWIKLHKDVLGGGICDLRDSRASSDYSCKFWKSIPYKRNKNKLTIEVYNE